MQRLRLAVVSGAGGRSYGGGDLAVTVSFALVTGRVQPTSGGINGAEVVIAAEKPCEWDVRGSP